MQRVRRTPPAVPIPGTREAPAKAQRRARAATQCAVLACFLACLRYDTWDINLAPSTHSVKCSIREDGRIRQMRRKIKRKKGGGRKTGRRAVRCWEGYRRRTGYRVGGCSQMEKRLKG